MLPALAASKRTAQWNLCRSNLGQLGVLTEGVMDKYDMNFPYFEPDLPADTATQRITMGAAYEGVSEPGEFLICPSDPEAVELEGWNTSYRYHPGESIADKPIGSSVGVFDGVRVRYLPGSARSVWGDRGQPHGDGRSNAVSYPDWIPQ